MRTVLPTDYVMQQNTPIHPSNDDLERFLLHQMSEEELEGMESHILACENCVEQLEEMELNLAATKLALSELHQQTVAANVAAQAEAKSRGWFGLSWLNMRSVSLAGATAALAFTFTMAPRYTPVEADLSALRGTEANTLPAGRPLLIHLDAKDLHEGTVSLALVAADGRQIWTSDSKVERQVVSAKLPPIESKGDYLLKVYAPKTAGETSELLREVTFDVR